jgi:hypothetical protein
MDVSGQLHAPAALTPGKNPGIPWLGGRVGPSTGLDDVERRQILPLPELELRPLGRQARSRRYSDCAVPALCVSSVSRIQR